ncbi:putative bifunctional diguanylate cyclase/phosphodiesterase [Micromonosporaceae bacterium Da 78-11]
MTSVVRQVERLRPTPLLVTAAIMQILAIILYAVNAEHQRISLIWGWLPAIVISALTVLATRHAASTSGLPPTAARLWRSIGWVALLTGLGTVGDARQSLVDPLRVTQQQHDVPTSICYVLTMGVLLWALLRLPVGRQRQRTFRFVLDALTVTVTVGIFSWYFAMRTLADGDGRRTTVPMIMLAVLGFIVALALIKIAVSGLGGLERGTIHWFAAAAVVGTAGGGLFPMLIDVHPGLSGSQIFIPATMICVALAADRQRRAAGAPRPVRRKLFSVVPYAAVTATDALLLMVSHESGGTVLTVALAAVVLTALVVVRQVGALRENGRLLRRVDENLTQLNQYQEELTHRATHDSLTDLANRALFEQAGQDAVDRAGNDGRLSLALIDLDDFKGVNDRLGHPVGDALLVVVAQRLRECVRTDDVVARLGGDEFGLLLPGLGLAAATDVLERIREALNRPVHALGHDLLVRASIGLAEAWPQADPQELLRRADVAMYAAKERGKGRYAVYDDELEQHQAADAQLGAELRRALDEGQFTLVYQPIVRLPDGAWTGLETLVRWPHAARGHVGPDVFIPIAERTGLIVPLGDWILRTALRQFSAWIDEYGEDAPHELGVNVSARQLREPGFAAVLGDALTESGVRPDRLVVEVTETAVFDGGVALDTLLDIVRLGVKVALDDFGTGHSSLGLLRTVPADTLKVDKSFVDGIGGSSEEAVIATAMIQITDGLHLQAVAEGVETADQADTLYRLGYRFAQGYHFSRPLAPGQVAEQLAATVAAPV